MYAYVCAYIYIFKFTSLIYEVIDIPCQLLPPYFSYIICILENKCSSLKIKKKKQTTSQKTGGGSTVSLNTTCCM